MKFATLAALALAPVALSQSSNSSQYLQQVLGALQGAGLTSLVQVASAIANDTNGMALLGQLAQGNKTVFAPNNDAFSQVPQNVSSNTTLLTQILSYHILNNTYTVNGTQVSPNHTIARTLLNGGMYQLPGNRSAPVVLSRNSTNATMFNIVQYQDNVTAMGPTPAANLYVYVINEVLSLPPTLVTLAQQLFPSLAGLIQQAGLLDPLSMAQGITVFAPSDSAVSAAAQALQSANQTVVQTVLANHVINGSVVYSDRLTSANYTSAAGEPFTFMTNSSGTYVSSANSTAKIIRSDLIVNNGVVHLIDGILLNTMSNPQAAQSAASSYASAAATQTENTTPVTATSAAATSGASTSRSAAGAAAPFSWTSTILGASLATLGLMVGGSATLF